MALSIFVYKSGACVRNWAARGQLTEPGEIVYKIWTCDLEMDPNRASAKFARTQTRKKLGGVGMSLDMSRPAGMV